VLKIKVKKHRKPTASMEGWYYRPLQDQGGSLLSDFSKRSHLSIPIYYLCNITLEDLLHSKYSGSPKREADVPTLRGEGRTTCGGSD
jgi:hypothetical protein